MNDQHLTGVPDDADQSNFSRPPGWYDDESNPALRRHWNGWKWDALELKNPPRSNFWRELIDLFTKRRH